jgi:hypothetical protein
MRQNARRATFSENSTRPDVSVGTLKSMKTRLGQSTSLIELDPRDSSYMNGQNIPFVNSVKYLGVIFDMKTTWRPHIEMIESKDFRTFIRIYSLFKSGRLSANIRLTSTKLSLDP